LLVFPFCVFAVWGFERLRLFSGRRVWSLVTVVLVFIVVGSGYSSGAFSYVGLIPNSYVAVDLVQSSIGWDQVDDLKAVVRWLDVNAVSGSAVLVEERFYGWTMFSLKRANTDVKVFFYLTDYLRQSALEKALTEGFRSIYLLWFANASLGSFQEVYSQNTVSVYGY
ncbi:MAG: hypothetical protein JSV85_00450, partial [Candidatus Bathyarchaeota archaeon]